MAFDPDAYLAQTATEAPPPFDPDAYLAQKKKEEQPQEPSAFDRIKEYLTRTPTPEQDAQMQAAGVDTQTPEEATAAQIAAYEQSPQGQQDERLLQHIVPQSAGGLAKMLTYTPLEDVPSQLSNTYDAIKKKLAGESYDQIAKENFPAPTSEEMAANILMAALGGHGLIEPHFAGEGKGSTPHPENASTGILERPEANKDVQPNIIERENPETGQKWQVDAKTGEIVEHPVAPEPEKPKGAPQWAMDELRARGWNTDWPFIPADLQNPSFVEAIKNDPGISEAERTKILSFTPSGKNAIKLEPSQFNVTRETPAAPSETEQLSAGEAQAGQRDTSSAESAGVGSPEAATDRGEAGRPTATKNAATDLAREEAGLPERISQAAAEDFGQQTWDEAGQRLEQDPNAGQRLVADINSGKVKAIDRVDNAILLREQIKARMEHSDAVDAKNAADKSGDPNAIDAAKARLQQARDNYQAILDADAKAGTELSHGFSARKMMANEDYSLARMEATVRAAQDGARLTDKQAKYIQDLQKRIETLERQQNQYNAGKARPRMERIKIRGDAVDARLQGKSMADFLAEKADAARTRIRQMAEEGVNCL